MSDHDAAPPEAICRDCGDLIPAGAVHLPGLCGPCSIPAEQDAARGRSGQSEALAALTTEYEAWLEANAVPEDLRGCAFELWQYLTLYGDRSPETEAKREWLRDFGERWDAVCDAGRTR